MKKPGTKAKTQTFCLTRSLGANEMQRGVQVTQLRKSAPTRFPEELFPQIAEPGVRGCLPTPDGGSENRPPGRWRSPNPSVPEASPPREGMPYLPSGVSLSQRPDEVVVSGTPKNTLLPSCHYRGLNTNPAN